MALAFLAPTPVATRGPAKARPPSFRKSLLFVFNIFPLLSHLYQA
ncbi:hypothetical protein DBT_2435 [Dissulfuribacter thermophilus]|uniref:Uncharacterized protein n=1 Tax=Dissulfuribacter thermophilus TaxID=1156395 RepID=A0A1B9F2L7_9BACT|nr:hypothetical protein DBT_2435 [Dissulfuribacter thermophilus]